MIYDLLILILFVAGEDEEIIFTRVRNGNFDLPKLYRF